LGAYEVAGEAVTCAGAIEDAAVQRVALGVGDLVAAAGVHAWTRGGELAVRKGDGEGFELCVEQTLDGLFDRQRGLEAEQAPVAL
jgi:hypothetical protein